MPPELSECLPWILLAGVFFLASALYGSVGHGGASAYLAVMGMVGMLSTQMKPIALILNIGVSLLAFVMFFRAGHFRWGLFLPLALSSVPAAFVGGWLESPERIYKLILAVSLLVAAWRLVWRRSEDAGPWRQPWWGFMVALGLGIGLLSGLIGIGGGIFLTPILILCRWASAKTAAAVSAAFILVNSVAGLGGWLAKGGGVPSMTWWLLPVVLAGGWAGARWGSVRAASPVLQRALALVLLVAAAKFMIR